MLFDHPATARAATERPQPLTSEKSHEMTNHPLDNQLSKCASRPATSHSSHLSVPLLLLLGVFNLFSTLPLDARPTPQAAPSNPSAAGVASSQINLRWQEILHALSSSQTPPEDSQLFAATHNLLSIKPPRPRSAVELPANSSLAQRLQRPSQRGSAVWMAQNPTARVSKSSAGSNEQKTDKRPVDRRRPVGAPDLRTGFNRAELSSGSRREPTRSLARNRVIRWD